MFIRCAVFPRPNSTPRQLQRLGEALRRWCRRESKIGGMVLPSNQDGIEALRRGTLPPADSQGRPVVVLTIRGGKHFSRKAIIDSLRRDLPANLIGDALVKGKSWDRGYGINGANVDPYRLLHGPYTPPRLRRGDRATCLYRDAEVVITSWSDARISWPRCRAIGTQAERYSRARAVWLDHRG